MAQSTVEGVKRSSSRRKKGLFYSLKNTSFGESRYYLFEYGLLLVLVGLLTYILIGMIRAFFAEVSIQSVFSYNISDPYIVMLSGLTILLPLVVILIQRTAELERNNPYIKNLAWRKGMLGVFLAAVSAGAISYAVLFVGSILTYLSLDALTGVSFNWEVAFQDFAAMTLLVITAWSFGNDYRYLKEDHFARLRHNYRYGLIISSVIIGFLFLVFPFRENRLALIDRMIVDDLTEIQTKVYDYSATSGQLPTSISELGLDPNQSQRASTYMYTIEKKSGSAFELCANFNLAAKNVVDNTVETTIFPDTGGNFISKLNSHGAGRDCFESPDQAVSAEGVPASDVQYDTNAGTQTFNTTPSDPIPLTEGGSATSGQ